MKKINIWVLVWVFLVGSVSLNACSENDEETAVSDQAATEEFLKQASAYDVFEITAGMLAEEKGKKSGVSRFGQQLVHVHSRTSEALETIAKRKSVQLPDDMPTDKKSLVNRLEEKEGTEFDKAFTDAQITIHQEAIQVYEQADSLVKDQEVQAYIDQILPVLKDHLAEIQKVQTNLLSKK